MASSAGVLQSHAEIVQFGEKNLASIFFLFSEPVNFWIWNQLKVKKNEE